MTSRIADADQNQLVFTFCFFKCFLSSPREPINHYFIKCGLQNYLFGYSNENGTLEGKCVWVWNVILTLCSTLFIVFNNSVITIYIFIFWKEAALNKSKDSQRWWVELLMQVVTKNLIECLWWLLWIYKYRWEGTIKHQKTNTYLVPLFPIGFLYSLMGYFVEPFCFTSLRILDRFSNVFQLWFIYFNF